MNELSLPQKARTLEEFAAACRRIRHFNREYKWRLGEWLVLHENQFGDKIYQYCDDLAMSKQDVLNCMSIYRRIGDQWTPEIGWSLWQALAPLTPEERDPLIQRALSHGISRAEIRAVAHSSNGTVPSTGNEGAMLPDRVSVAETAVAEAYVEVGGLMRRGIRGAELQRALERLIAAAVILSEMLETSGMREKQEGR